ncbi:MAG: UDP-4-amino-4-deoxy-L-arabinose aminotransferase [Phycisphaerales bacterium]|nr:UDP-4-amino-4-deoxy-L-arabinose aminotransferase [Phycisphaerales bacterium]
MRTDFLPFARPSISEEDIQAVVQTLRSGWITTGSQCAALEGALSARLDGAQVVAAASGTAVMDLVLRALEIGPGDEVITPSMTWVSTVNLITLRGATPVFVDVDRDTMLVTPEAIEAAITDRTRAVIPVHYCGAPCDMHPIRAICQTHGVYCIEDAAHAIGTSYDGVEVGGQGTAIFSLHPIKTITTGEGGLLATDDEDLARRVRRLRFHGLEADAHDRRQHGRTPTAQVREPGLKANLPDMNAVLGLSQLDRLDAFIDRRDALTARYREGLASIDGISPVADPTWTHRHGRHLMIVRVEPSKAGMDRDELMRRLKDANIGTGLHFLAVHTHDWYRDNMAQWSGRLPNTEYNSDRICSLPLFPDMTDEDVDSVLDSIRAALACAKVPA